MKKNLYCDPPCRHSLRRVNLTLIKSLIFIMLLGAVTTNAAGFAQNAKITMDVRNMPLAEVLQQLSMQSETDFIYSRTLIESKGNVSVKAAGRELSLVLSQILPELGLEYTFDDNVVIIRERQAAAQQQSPQTITGMVVDSKGKPVVNASVSLKSDSKVGTTTDAAGRFSLRTPRATGNVLVVSFLGKKTAEYPYSGQGEVRVVLEDQVLEMGEVVVTGIFNKPKESFTGSAVMVTREELRSASGRGAIQAIANLVPGFNIIENNLAGSNPNNLPYVSIRGTSNIASDITGAQADLESMAKANQPLIIMNGFEISMETFKDLDENQIENVTILKDASAAAMYGTKGSNGVIVITTVKPEQGRLRVTYKGGIEIQAADLNSYNLMNAREKLEFETLAGLYTYKSNPILDKELKDLYNQRLLQVERGVDTYWIKYPVHTGIGHTHSLTIDGGAANFRYGGNISYKNIEGTMKGNKRNTFNGNMYLQYSIDDFMFSNDLYVSTVMAKESPYGTFSDYSKLNQYFAAYDDEGKIKKILEDQNYYIQNLDKSMVANPLYNAFLPSKNQSETLSVRNNFSAEWKVTQDLLVRGRLGLTRETGRRDVYKSADHTDFMDYSEENYTRKGTYTYSPSESFKWDGRLSANYTKTINDKHMIFGGVEFSMSEEQSESYIITAEGLSVLTMDFLGQAASYTKDGSPSGTEMTTRTGGMAFTGNYTYDNRYTLDVSGKYDGSSQFGKNNRFNWFWSTGAGWNLHHEEFMRDVEWIDYARFRVSYGVTGDPVRRAYQSLRTYTTPSGSSYNGWYGVYIDTWGNPDLKMATQGQFNVGFDWEILDRRVRINFDVYDKKTENSIMAIDIPYSSGFSSYYANIGSVSNRGFDLSANFTPLLNKNNGLRLDVGFIMSHNKNKLLKISNSLESLLAGIDTGDNTNPSFAYEEGKSLNTIFVVKSKGIDPSTGNEIFIKRDGTETFTWDSKDRVACGTTDADIEGSINANARYKGFYLKMFFRYRLGGQAYNNSLASKVENINAYNNADRRALYDRWKKSGDLAKFKSIALVSETKWTSRFVMDNDIFELSTITFGYDVPREWSRTHLGIDYVSMQTTFNDIMYTSTIKRERGLSTPFSRLFTFALTIRF